MMVRCTADLKFSPISIMYEGVEYLVEGHINVTGKVDAWLDFSMSSYAPFGEQDIEYDDGIEYKFDPDSFDIDLVDPDSFEITSIKRVDNKEIDKEYLDKLYEVLPDIILENNSTELFDNLIITKNSIDEENIDFSELDKEADDLDYFDVDFE